MPRTDRENRARLAASLTEVFAEATDFPADIFGIRFHEYEYGGAASGGALCNGDARPYLHFLLYCPRLGRTAKRKIVENMSRVFAETIGQPTWLPVIHVCEHPYDNVGVDGKLLSDSYESCAGAEFYYDLPGD